MKDFVIPVNDAIINFDNHLNAYPRTILSSKFGDGKSYFLKKVNESSILKDKYEFLTIYPVNYQVAGNKDIFELIKRDILFQLLLHEMIEGDTRITESEAFSWFLQNNGGNVLMDIISYIAEVGLETTEGAKILAAIKGLRLFKELGVKYHNFKRKELITDDDRIDAFLEKVDSKFVYECDVITKIIQKSIKNYQKRTKKKVVLIVEDLDRIDPAHLFRILNVLSAHIDYPYKNFVKPDNSLYGNKFALDNIVLVIDFTNLKNIYKHFYGEHTDFKGYISKFLSGVPFYYSLEKQKYNYVVDQLTDILDLDRDFIKSFFTKDILNSHTMRETVQSFDLEHCIVSEPFVTCDGITIHLNTSFLRMMSIMRKLKWSDDEIIGKIYKLKTDNQTMFVQYVLPYTFIDDAANNKREKRLCLSLNGEKPSIKQVILNQNGTSSIGGSYMRRGNEVESNLVDDIKKMLEYIV